MSKLSNFQKIESEAEFRNIDDEDSDFYPDDSDSKSLKNSQDSIDEYKGLMGLDEESSGIATDDSTSDNQSSSENNNSDDTGDEPRQDKRWQRFKRTREEKRLLTEQLEDLAQRNAQMEHLLKISMNVSQEQEDMVVKSELAKAQAMLTQSLEEGNPEAVSEATYYVAQATQNLQEASRKRKFDESAPNPAAYKRSKEQLLYEWLLDNPEVDKSSEEHNPSISEPMINYINKLENKLRRGGQAHLIGTPGYFNTLDTYRDSLVENKSAPRYFGKVSSRQSGSSRSSSSNGRIDSSLAPHFKVAAASFNMTDKEYMQMYNSLNKGK